MATSETSIVNVSMIKIGSLPIESLTDTNNPNAIKANAVYEPLRDEVLAAFQWKFAMDGATLAKSLVTPDFKWAFQYALPSGSLRVREMLPARTPYSIESGWLRTDYDNAYGDVSIRFTKKITDPEKFSAEFIDCLATRIAQELAVAIKADRVMAQMFAQDYDKTLLNAKMLSQQEDYIDKEAGQDTWDTIGRYEVR